MSDNPRWDMEPRDAIGVTPEWQARAQKRMARIDAMPREIRGLVHEYGLTIVDAFVGCGVTSARHIRHLVKTVMDGASRYGNNNGGGLVRSRCADLGMHVNGMSGAAKAECIAAFLNAVNAKNPRARGPSA